MANDTLREEKKELETETAAALGRAWQAIVLAGVLFVMLVAQFFPAALAAVLWSTWPYALVAAVAAAATSRVLRRGKDKKKKM